MGYILKIDKTKQQINFLNCDNIDKWIDTCQEVTNSYDVVEDNIDLPIEGGVLGEDILVFEFAGSSRTFKLNGESFTATISPYVVDISDLGIDTLTSCNGTFGVTYITRLITFPDTSNVTSMKRMFDSCSVLTSLDLSSFNTSNVTDMSQMFQICTSLTSLDVSHFDTSNVTDMGFMFYGCNGLTSVDLSSFNTSKVTSMVYMFNSCNSLTSLDLSGWDTSNVTNTVDMFNGCNSLQTIYMKGCNQATIDMITSVKPTQAQIITE